jgi:divalent metal cation (Fe/Co/Zn/Cd) transporter
VSGLPVPLVERSKEEITEIIKKRVKAIRDVRGCHQVSVRMTGKRLEVDMHVLLDSDLRFEDVHKIASEVEREVKNVFPNARVTVHTEPVKSGKGDAWKVVKGVADEIPGSRGVHSIHIQKIDGKVAVDLHLEVSANMTVKQAHDVADKFERKLRAAINNIEDITVHLESASDRVSRELTGVDTDLESYIEHVAERFPEIKFVHGIGVRRVGENLHVVLRCHFDPDINMEKVHEISSSLEKEIRSAYPRIVRIDVHEEPT